MKITAKKLVISIIATLSISISLCADNAFADRKIDYNSIISSPQSNSNDTYNLNSSKNVNLSGKIKDRNEKLYGIVGKSQLLKFDEPVTRVSITEPQFADIVLLSPKELLLNCKKTGRTSLIFWGSNNQPAFYNLVVQQDSDAFIQAVSEIAPNENCNLIFTDDGVLLSGYISSTGTKEKIKNIAKAYGFNLVDMSESPTKQVLLEVKITEASRNFTNTLSSQFSFGRGAGLGNANSGGFDGNGFQYMFSSDSANLAMSLYAGEQNGNVKILAEPKLLALDNAEASFNVGNEVPVPSSIGNYGNVSYSFKNTGVILNFKPTILEKSNRIILKLSPEVSEIDNSIGNASTPGFKTRKVDTTVELGDGETLIIAGLLKQTSSRTRNQVPWVGNIPLLGLFFQNKTDSKGDTELVIFITPRIVEMDSTTAETL